MAGRQHIVLMIDVETTSKHDSCPTSRQNAEIIRVDVAKCNLTTLNLYEPSTIRIKPTSEEGGSKTSFKFLCEYLRKTYKSHTKTWVTWGDSTQKQFIRQCEREGVSFPFTLRHYNFKHFLEFAEPSFKTSPPNLDSAAKFFGLNGTNNKGSNLAELLGHVFIEFIRRYRNEKYIITKAPTPFKSDLNPKEFKKPAKKKRPKKKKTKKDAGEKS